MLGRLCATLPERPVRWLCVCFGWVIGHAQLERRRTVLRNIHHAFPDQTERWRRQVYNESCARIVEMGLFLAASAYFKPARLQATVSIDAATEAKIREWFEQRREQKRSAVLLVPHVTLAEATVFIPSLLPDDARVSVIFRPLNQPKVNEWVGEMRSRFGARMLSRKNGFNEAMAELREGELVGVLFDQNATKKGSMITFFDRVCSATDLPGLFAKRFDSDIFLVIPERIGLWRARLHLEQLPRTQNVEEVVIRAHERLETYLKQDFNKTADWLWLHKRWEHQMRAKKRFKLNPKKSHLAAQNTLLGRVAVPRVTRLYIRMPNWLGDVVMALPLISAIRKGRPDMRITLIGKAAFKPLFDRFCISDDFIPLPPKGWGYFLDFYKRRLEYPDTFLLFTNSSRGDMEAFFTRCPQRMGMLRPGKKRPLLTDGYDLPDDVDETQIHQTHVWEKMLRSFGLLEALDYSPLPRKPQTDRPQVGLICGSENSPEKRWPISHWRVLVEQLLEVCPEVEILLFGTPMDDAITSEVAKGFAESSVRNLAGKTNLVEFCDALQSARTIVCNDTGGMHLANMFGTPVVAIFGPTNPVRTGPIFEGPTTILQPPGCPKTGGSAIEGVAPESVLAAIQPNLEVRDCE